MLAKAYEGKLLNGPNDVWVRPDGGIYFTDPFYKREYWQRGPQEQDKRCVYFLTAGEAGQPAGGTHLPLFGPTSSGRPAGSTLSARART